MKAEDRRKEIALYLMSKEKPASGAELAERFHVSRQIIVQDVALLKAQGYEVVSTHYGYVINKSPLVERVFKLYHNREQTREELMTIVQNGGTVVDDFVWHKVYGRIEAKLNIFSEYHIDKFLEGVRTGKSTELMDITGGYHYHTVRADSEKTMNVIENALQEKGFLAPENL